MKYLVVGLGNIGPEYQLTRHNIGFQIVDHLAKEQQVTFQSERMAFVTSFRYKGKMIYLIKPTTYMNQSGKAVQYWLQKLKITPENSLTIVDDLALSFGKLRLRADGSSGGHNGLKSIEFHLGTTLYPRLRFGIGCDFVKGRQADYVLASFSPDEISVLSPLMHHSCQVTYTFCTNGLVKAKEFCSVVLVK